MRTADNTNVITLNFLKVRIFYEYWWVLRTTSVWCACKMSASNAIRGALELCTQCSRSVKKVHKACCSSSREQTYSYKYSYSNVSAGAAGPGMSMALIEVRNLCLLVSSARRLLLLRLRSRAFGYNIRRTVAMSESSGDRQQSPGARAILNARSESQ